MKKYSCDEAIQILHRSAIAYREKLAGRVFIVVYRDEFVEGGTAYKRIVFSTSNFQHLTGVRYTDKADAKVFFQMCCNNRLSPSKLRFSKDGVTHLKLAVLPYLADVMYNRFWIGTSINNDIYINADYFVGDTKNHLSLGIRHANRKDVPVSLKNQSVRHNVDKIRAVYAVYSRSVSRENLWECVYIDQKIVHEANKEVLPKEIRELWTE